MPFDTKALDRALRRVSDIVISIIALLFFSIPTLFLCLLTKIESPHLPVLFWQLRVGEDNKLFWLPKVRTVDPNIPAPGPCPLVRKGKDPRITPLGEFIRGSKLDEVPQFLLVIIGTMSLVGSRPLWWRIHLKYVKLCPWYIDRMIGVKPAITGGAIPYGSEVDLPGELEEQIWQQYALDKRGKELMSIGYYYSELYKTAKLILFGERPEIPSWLANQNAPSAILHAAE